jgi:hypothetical protein
MDYNNDNPYYQSYAGSSAYPASTSRAPANAFEYDVGLLAQQSVYVPGAMIDKRGGSGGKLAKGGKRTTVLRKGGGKVWEDQTLLEWNPCSYSYCRFCCNNSLVLSLVPLIRRRPQQRRLGRCPGERLQ